MTTVWITLAGALGCLVRFAAEYAARLRRPTIRPWATVAANTLGCLIAGWVAYRFTASADAHQRAILLTGFCGGLTTFSSAFAIPAIIAREHHRAYAISLVVATPLLCAAAYAVGAALH